MLSDENAWGKENIVSTHLSLEMKPEDQMSPPVPSNRDMRKI